MSQKRTVKKRTTPEMSAEYRLKKWQESVCPYCGGNITSRKEVQKVQGGPVTGIHFRCLTDTCRAENYFSGKQNLQIAGVE